MQSVSFSIRCLIMKCFSRKNVMGISCFNKVIHVILSGILLNGEILNLKKLGMLYLKRHPRVESVVMMINGTLKQYFIAPYFFKKATMILPISSLGYEQNQDDP